MRVLILHPALTPYRVDLFNALAKRVDLHVVFLQENAVAQRFDRDDLIHRSQFRHDWFVDGVQVGRLYFRSGLRGLLNRVNPDVVVTHEFLGVSLQLLVALRSRNTVAQVVWTSENLEIHGKQSLVRKTIKWLFLKWVQGLIVYTNEMAMAYRESLGYRGHAAVVPNIPDARVFRGMLSEAESESKRWVSRYQWQSTKVILFVGRLAAEKAVHRLLRALVGLEGGGVDFALAIVGDGPERQALENLAIELGVSKSVFFFGRREGLELAGLYRVGTLFVLPSVYEPFGAVVNEALVAGMPVVCTHEVGAKVFIENGKNGAVVDGDSEGELCEQIATWLTRGSPAGERVEKLEPSLLPVELDAVVDGLVDTLGLIVEENRSGLSM